MGAHKKINISIVVLSAVATFLQTLILSVSALYETRALQIIVAVLNAALVAIQSLQLNLKNIRSRINSNAETPTTNQTQSVEMNNPLEDI